MAISVSWPSIPGTDYDPDSPLTTGLFTNIVNRTTYLEEWLGYTYLAGADRDHNHDGVNSALVPVGTNRVRNGSFETDLSGWTTTVFTGGTVARDATGSDDGAARLAITSTVLANGGGTARTNEYMTVSSGAWLQLMVTLWASVIGVSSKAEVVWYDSAKTQISLSALTTLTTTPTVALRFGGPLQAPANARYARVLITGGIPATGTATGTIYVDNVAVIDLAMPTALIPIGVMRWGYRDMPQASTIYCRTVGVTGDGTENNQVVLVSKPMTITQLRVFLNAAVPAAQSAVVTLRKNGVDTPLTCTLAAGATTGSNTVNSVTAQEGDYLTLKVVTSATFTSTIDLGATMVTTGIDGRGAMNISLGGGNSTATPVLGEFIISNSEANGEVPLPACRLIPAPNAHALTGALTRPPEVRRNQATPYIAAVGTVIGDPYGGRPEAVFAANDLFNLKQTEAIATALFHALAVAAPDANSYAPCWVWATSYNQAQATTAYASGYGINAGRATENEAQIPMPACTVYNLRAAASAAPPASQTCVITLRKNGVDTALTCTITSAGRIATDVDISHAVTFAAGDLLSWKVVSSATAGTLTYNLCAETVLPALR